MRLRDGGYREIILTGIQLGAYGLDLEAHSRAGERHYLLRDVIEAIARIEGIERIRLSSIEPMDWDGELVSLMAEFGGTRLARPQRATRVAAAVSTAVLVPSRPVRRHLRAARHRSGGSQAGVHR